MKTRKNLLWVILLILLFNCKEIEIDDLTPFNFAAITPAGENYSVREKITFTAETKSSDDRGLSYLWLTTSGTLYTPREKKTLWKAPEQAGMVTLTCLVTDLKTKKELRHTRTLNITAPLLGPEKSSSEAVTTDIRGNVGIGTDTPEATLDVAGTAKISEGLHVRNVNIAGMIEVNGVTFAHVPRGIIVMWSGATNDLPEGWVLCDEKTYETPNEQPIKTPNLQNRFIVAAGTAYSEGSTGGADRVTLTAGQMPAHNHSGNTAYNGSHTHSYNDVYHSEYIGLTTNYVSVPGNLGCGNTDTDNVAHQIIRYSASSGFHRHSITTNGSNQSHENRPPYYALAFIMKL